MNLPEKRFRGVFSSDGLIWSLRFAFRQLMKTPGFTLTAFGTLALCLGANLAIFAVVDAILMRPLPFPQSSALVAISNAYPGAGVERSGASIPNYFDRRHAIPALSSLSIYNEGSVIVGETGAPDRVATLRVTPEFFETLGVPLAMGHGFTDAELKYGTDEIAILTDDFWRAHFHADPEIVGKNFFNDGLAITVIAVLPRNFRFLSSRAQFFRPLAHDLGDRNPQNRHNNSAGMIARLAPGHSLAEAQAQLDALNARLAETDPFAEKIKAAAYRTNISPLHADHVREVKPLLVLLQCGVLSLVAIGVVNLANLFLIRANARSKELAVRQALGAGKRHIVGEILAETLLLACGGGVLGLLLGAGGIRVLSALGAERLPLGATVEFDSRIAAISLGIALVIGVLLAAPVVWFALHTKLAVGLQAESRSGTAGPAAQRLRHGFIVAQVALAFVLLSSAGLLGLSLKRVLAAPTGIRPDNILTGRLALPWKNYRDEKSRLAFIERLLPAIRALPGVTHAAISYDPPFTPGGSDGVVMAEGYVLQPGESPRPHYQLAASSEYWTTMGIPLLRGRFLEDADNHREERVCVVDQDFAQRYWPGTDPIGRHVNPGLSADPKNTSVVVGVVGSVKQNDLTETGGHGAVYFPYVNFATTVFSLVVRTSLPPAALAPAVRAAILQLDPQLPIDEVKPMRTLIDDTLGARRSPAMLAGIFAVVAVLLAALGTYGVLAYAVTQRRREIGVRMALGALPAQISRQFFLLGLRLLAIGMLLGIGGAFFAGHGMRSVLFEVPPLPLATLAATAAVMTFVTLAASLLPARRASRVNPMVALRTE